MMKKISEINITKMLAPLTLMVLFSCTDEFYEDVDALNDRYNPAASQDEAIDANEETKNGKIINELDQDNDFYSDAIELQLGSDPTDPLSIPQDSDNDQIPDYLDAYPFDPTISVKKIKVSQSNLDYDVVVEVLGMTKILSPNEVVEFTVGNLDYSVNFTSIEFNEFTRCEIKDESIENQIDYQCRAWISSEILNQGYPLDKDEDDYLNKTYCTINTYNVDGVYADEIENLYCYGLFYPEFINLFSNIKSLEFYSYSSEYLDDIKIDKSAKLTDIYLNGMDLDTIEFNNCDELLSVFVDNSTVNGVDILNCSNIESFVFSGELNYLITGELDSEKVTFFYNWTLLTKGDFLGSQYIIIDNVEIETNTEIGMDYPIVIETNTGVGTGTGIDTGTQSNIHTSTETNTQIRTQTDIQTGTNIETSTDTNDWSTISTDTYSDMNTQTFTSY